MKYINILKCINTKFVFLILTSVNFLNAQSGYEVSYTFTDKDNYICNSTLYLVKNESVFRVNDNRIQGQDPRSRQDNMIIVQNDEISKVFYSTEKIATTRIPLYKSEIIYSDLNNKIKYKLTGRSKKINKYDCQEAKFNLNGRKYTVWFTQEVETNFGPFKINGLPGLITEVFEETNKVHILFKGIRKLTDLTEFQKYKKYILSKKVWTYDEFENNITKLMTAKKKRTVAIAAESNAIITINEDQSMYTQFLVDIPKNLVSELQKIKF